MINTLGKLNKFFANYYFDKIIIKKNKNIIRLLVNAILDKFLKNIIILNMILFAKIWEIIVKKKSTINHNNNYSTINNTIKILKFL